MAVELAVDGQVWTGWTRASARRSIEEFAGSWDLEVTQRAPRVLSSWTGPTDWPALPIQVGSPCALGLDGLTVMSGYVDEVANDFGPQNHTTQVRGRNRGADVVDCDVLSPWEYGDITLPELVGSLVSRVGLKVRSEVDTGQRFARFSISPGETIFQCIERACRMRAVLPMMDSGSGVGSAGRTFADATLILTRAGLGGLAPVSLRVGAPGGNVLRGGGRTSWSERHSEIHCLGQQEHQDRVETEQAAGPAGVVTDGEIDRFRPRVVLAEQQGDGITLRERAAWQVAVRRGQGTRRHYVVQGWRTSPDGPLWAPNWLVDVHDPIQGDGRFLIVSTAMTLDMASGSLTTLSLTSPEAYTPEPGGGA